MKSTDWDTNGYKKKKDDHRPYFYCFDILHAYRPNIKICFCDTIETFIYLHKIYIYKISFHFQIYIENTKKIIQVSSDVS